MKKLIYFQVITLILLPVFLSAQLEISADSLEKETQKCRKWAPVPIPILGYDNDQGFQYGAAVNIDYFGDCSLYPQFFHSLYLEISRFTRGSGVNQVFFDTRKLIPGVRVTTDVTYLTEKALNFYGFNGYEAVYSPEWENDEDTAYKTRMFYRHERELLRIDADFQGKLPVRHLNWFAGLTFLNINTGSVDTARLNKGQDQEKKLPPVPGLYDHYRNWGIIRPDETGGINNMVKAGLVYDSRDNEVFTLKGIWTEAMFSYSPSFLGNTSYSFLKFTFIHRQYLQLIKNDLVLAYRLAYQGTIAGEAPFYIQPIMLNTYSKATTIDGLGGSRTLRDILRNRVVGDGVVFGNAELRWKFWRFKLFGWDFSTTASAFADAGMVVQPVKFDKNAVPDTVRSEDYFSSDKEKPHLSYGAGFQLGVLSFVITVDYGRATDRRDGRDGFYVGFSYLF